MIQEKDIERRLTRLAEKHGGRCLKWTCPGWKGVPDRILLFPGGRIIFVETKRPKGGKVAPLQKWWKDELRRLGFLSLIVSDDQGLDSLEAILPVLQAEGRPV